MRALGRSSAHVLYIDPRKCYLTTLEVCRVGLAIGGALHPAILSPDVDRAAATLLNLVLEGTLGRAPI